MDLIYYTPHQLYSYAGIAAIDPVQQSFSQMFNPSICLIDRSNTINCPPIPIKVLDPFYKWNSPKTFNDISHARFDDILQTTMRNGKQLVLFYSGGIDSTMIVALAISHPEFIRYRSRILLVLSEDSIAENPNFWYDQLIPAFKDRLASASAFHILIADENNVCVTGEFADNIFGSLTVKSYMDATGDRNAIHKPFRSSGLHWLLSKITITNHRDKCGELMDQIFATNPNGCESNHDCFWWLNFVLKWQAVKFRLASHAPTAESVDGMIRNVVHFFETTDFQDWAVLTDEEKVQNDWYSYKLPAKKLILSINNDQYYFQWKTKYPSIPSLTRYTNMFDFIYYDHTISKYIASKQLLTDVANANNV